VYKGGGILKLIEARMNAIINSSKRLKKVLDKYGEAYFNLPPSISGKYHKREKNLKEHIERCLFFAFKLCEVFRPYNELEILEAVILHDIGKVITMKKGKHEGGKYYPATGYTYMDGTEDHGTEGARLLKEYGFPNSICEMVRNHMSHWEGKTPTGLDEWIVAAADYLASRDEILILDEEMNRDE